MTGADLMLLETLIEQLVDRARAAIALRKQMIAEGRTTLTADELVTLQGDDNRARAELVAAIDAAQASGR